MVTQEAKWKEKKKASWSNICLLSFKNFAYRSAFGIGVP